MRIEKLKRNFDIDVQLIHFPLHADTPAEGRTLQDMFGCGPEEIDEKNANMQRLMKAEGLPYNDRTNTYNSRLAQELGTWADSLPDNQGEPIHLAIYQAYFVDHRNIGDVEVLVDLAKSVGLDADAARDVVTNRTFKDAVDADWNKSGEYGVRGVPTFVAGGSGTSGAQPYEMLAGLLTDAGATATGNED